MDWFGYALIAAACLCVLVIIYSEVMSWRNDMVFFARRKAIDLTTRGYLTPEEFDARSYTQMLYDFRKWSFKDFYPDLAAREASEC